MRMIIDDDKTAESICKYIASVIRYLNVRHGEGRVSLKSYERRRRSSVCRGGTCGAAVARHRH